MGVSFKEFHSLSKEFPIWAELKAHVTSEWGARVIESETNPGLAIIRYTKEKRDISYIQSLFRSVIWNTIKNCPVCVAPIKAISGLPPMNKKFTQIDEFVDGVMIQAFIQASDPNTIQLATRTQIGAKNAFYGSKSFGEMFNECLASTPVRNMEILRMHMREYMEITQATSVFVSFVIQHPEHRIVVKNNNPDLYIVHIGAVDAGGIVTVSENSAEWLPPLRRLQIPKYPIQIFNETAEIDELMRRTAIQNSVYWQGLVFKDGTGARWRVQSPSYLLIRALRGNEAKAVERFLRLRRDGNVISYLKYYPEDRSVFSKFESTLRKQTLEAYNKYISVHKSRSAKFADIEPVYKPILHLAHVEYLERLRSIQKSVQLNVVIKIVNNLKIFEQKRLIEAFPA